MNVLMGTAAEAKNAIEEITSAMRDIANEVISLRDISTENSENVATLAHELEKFRID